MLRRNEEKLTEEPTDQRNKQTQSSLKTQI